MRKLSSILLGLSAIMFSYCTDPGDVQLDLSDLQDASIEQVKDSASIQQQIDKLNNAGEFFTFNLKVLEGGEPIENATVTLTGGSDGAEFSAEATTNASGIAFFEAVSLGGNIMEVRAENYYSVIALVEFKFIEGINYEVVDDVVIPITRNESAIIPLYPVSASAKNFATIKGNAFIETDLTNSEAEAPVGAIIKANFSGNNVETSDGLNFKEYTLNAEGGVGQAEVNEDGTYELLIPTSVNGSNVEIIFDEYEADQILARFDDDGNPTIDTARTLYGRGFYYSNIPNIPGAKIVFDEPAREGSGFDISNIDVHGVDLFPRFSLFPGSNETIYAERLGYILKSGKNFQSTPILNIQDPKGSGFESQIELRIAVDTLVLTDTGAYQPGEFVNAYIYYKETEFPWRSFLSFSVNADADGNITQEGLNSVLSNSGNRSGWNDNFVTISEDFDSVWVEFQAPNNGGKAAAADLKINSAIGRINILNAGQEYTNPVAVFTGGNPEEHAELTIRIITQLYSFEPDNSSIVDNYVLLPKVDFEVLDDNNQYRLLSDLYFWNNSTYYLDVTNNISGKFNDFFEVANGNIVKKDPNATIIINFHTRQAPIPIVHEQKHNAPVAQVRVDNSGKVFGIFTSSRGNGYAQKFSAQIMPIIEGLPGSGSTIQLIGGELENNQYSWFGDYRITNGGEGYRQSLNQYSSALSFFFTGDYFYKLTKGEVLTRDIQYGSGRRLD